MRGGSGGNPGPGGDEGGGSDHGKGDNKLDLVVVVNGQPVEIEANLNAPLLTVREKALAETENVGQEPDNWDLKDRDGNVLDLSKKLGEFGFAAGTTLFLSVKAGVAGA